MFFVYILVCSDGSYYVGHTHDIARRLENHAAGIAAVFTRERRPVRLVYCESQPTREEAVQRERQIKGWSRAKKEALIRGDLARLHSLSRCRRA